MQEHSEQSGFQSHKQDAGMPLERESLNSFEKEVLSHINRDEANLQKRISMLQKSLSTFVLQRQRRNKNEVFRIAGCPYCHLSFGSGESLKGHVKNKHGIPRNLISQERDTIFYKMNLTEQQIQNLRNHQMKVEPFLMDGRFIIKAHRPRRNSNERESLQEQDIEQIFELESEERNSLGLRKDIPIFQNQMLLPTVNNRYFTDL